MKECLPQQVSFSTETTTCGPQPRYKNSTISLNGWELTAYQPCYWNDHYVNFNGKHYVYRNDTWKLAEATIIQMEQDWPLSFRYTDDNSYKYQPSTNPDYKAFITNPMNIMADLTAAMADLTAAMAEHSNHPLTQQETSPLMPVRTIIMTAAEKNSRYRIIKLVETIKLVLFFNSLALFFAFLFDCFLYIGIFACLYAMCCKLRPHIRPRSRSRRAQREVIDKSTPV